MQVINKAMYLFYLLSHTGESSICKGLNWQWKSKVPKLGKQKNVLVCKSLFHTTHVMRNTYLFRNPY